jgi:hypothetical protein
MQSLTTAYRKNWTISRTLAIVLAGSHGKFPTYLAMVADIITFLAQSDGNKIDHTLRCFAEGLAC